LQNILDKLRNKTSSQRGHRPFLLALLFFSLYFSYLILKPFLHTIVLAVLLASLFYPLEPPLLRLYRGRKNLMALTAVAIITFLIVIPVLFFMSALVSQGIETVNQVNEWIGGGNLQELLQQPRAVAFTSWVKEHLDFVRFSELDVQGHLLQMSKNFGQFVLRRGAAFLGDVANMFFYFFVMIFITFYLVRDGEVMLRGIKQLSPLREQQEERIIEKVKSVARSVLLGSFLTALLQGVLGGIGLALVGIPALFWGTVLGFSSLIPVVGTALVWVPAAGYLALFGKWKAALFLSAWSIALVGSVDNFLRPFLMRGEGKLSPFYIFLAIIGGMKYFGIRGLLYGPIILGLASVMLYIYQVEYRELLDEKKEE
jgi:predicted PurR-regulated permease PerM